MKKCLFFFISLTAICDFSFSQGAWTQKSKLGGTVRYGAVGFSIVNKAYIGTGEANNYSTFYNDFWEWNPATNTWTQKASLPGNGRGFAVGFSIGTKGYIGTGAFSYSTNVFTQQFWEWDQATNTWTQKANFGGGVREAAIGFSIGNKGYIGMGEDSANNFYNDFWEWDQATNIWTQKTNLPSSKRVLPVGFSIGNKGYVGVGANPPTLFYNDFWEWNQATNTWAQKANFAGIGRHEATGFAIGSYGYLGTGTNWNLSYAVSDWWKYDVLNNIWTQVASFGGGIRECAVGFSIGCKGYLGTGWINDIDTTTRNDLWEFNPDTIGNILVNAASSTNTLCVSQPVTLTACCGVNYSWSTGSTSISTIVTPTATSTYSVAVLDGCDSASAFITITFDPPFNTNITGNTNLCIGKSETLIASGGNNYSWNNGATTQTISVSPSSMSTYSVIATNSNGCTADTFFTVTVNPNPTAIAVTSTTTITYGQTATLTATGGGNYLWSTGENDSIISVSPTQTTIYCVTVTDSNNCSATSCVTVEFIDVCTSGIYLPNAFSPNNDSENDFLRVYYENALCIKTLHIILYDRFGEKVFESDEPSFNWDGMYKGKALNSQVLAYSLTAELIDGKSISKKGNVSLVR